MSLIEMMPREDCQTDEAARMDLFVAPNLESWEDDTAGQGPSDISSPKLWGGLCFRRLDPDYYAWLLKKMKMAETAFRAGRLRRPAYNKLQARFIRVQAWAIERFGRKALDTAYEALDVRRYRAPGAPGK